MTSLAILSVAIHLAASPSPSAAVRKPASTQLYFEQATVSSLDGHAGPAQHVRVWCAGPRLRMEDTDAGGVIILRLDQGRAYRLDAQTRTAHLYPASAVGDASREDLAEAGGEIGTAAAAAFTSRPLPGTKTVAGHRCRGYRLLAGETEVDVYVARDLPVGLDAFSAFLRWSGAEKALPGFLATLRKLGGFPLETRARWRTGSSARETVATITAIRVGPAEPRLFEPPAGYRVARPDAEGGPKDER